MNRSRAIGLLVVITFIVMIYVFGLRNDLVFDDALLLEEHFRQSYGEAFSIKQRFLSYGSFFWSEALFGGGWWKQRALNILLHVGTTVALFGFYRTLLPFIRQDDRQNALDSAGRHEILLSVAIGFFALNPVAVYAVAYLIQRSILMATLAVVIGLWCFTLGLSSGKKGFFVAAIFAYIIALASKEHALLAPLCAIAVYVFVRRPAPKIIALFAAGSVAAALVAGAFFFLVYGRIIGMAFDEFSVAFLKQLDLLSPGVSQQAWPLSILNQMYLFLQYGLRWIVPVPGWLSIDLRPPFPLSLWSMPHLLGVLAYGGVLASGTWLLFAKRDEKSLLGLSLLLPALLFGTEFAIVWVQDPFVLYRSYLWAIGIPGLIVAVLYGVPSRALMIIGAILAVLLAAGSLNRLSSLASPITAWGDAIATLSEDPRAVGRWRPYLNRGEAYVDKGLPEQALRDFIAADAMGDVEGYGQFNRGIALYILKKYPAAVDAFTLAEKKGFPDANLFYQRGLALIAQGKLKEAHADFERAIQRNIAPPIYWSALAQRGMLALDLGDAPSAVRDLEQALPNLQGGRLARTALGVSLALTGQAERARDLLNDSLRQAASPPAFFGRALAFYTLRQKADALADIEAALRLSPRSPRFEELRDKIRALP